MSIPRPLQHLNTAVRLYPRMALMVDEFRSQRGNGLPRWPDWCFLPMAAWYAIVSRGNNVERLTPHLAGDVARLAAIGTWRYSQGIYRVDQSLMAGLAESALPGDMPAEVLYRLPEWCVYVETPGMRWMSSALHGFWAHLEWDANTERTELRLLLDLDKDLVGIPLHIGRWTLQEAVSRSFHEAGAMAAAHGLVAPRRTGDAEAVALSVQPIISILLYLCSDEPEIDDMRRPGSSPSRPRPKKTQKGWRLFPPARPRTWVVGAGIGDQLRAAATADGLPTGRTVRTHLRRGHWHGFWTGPRESIERRFHYKWLPPMVVAGANASIQRGP